MAVAHDNSAKMIGTSTVVAVCTLTITTGAVLIVGVNSGTDVSVSACAAGGTPMTKLGTGLNDAGGQRGTLFALTAAPSGVISISANFVGGVALQTCIVGASYTGASPTNPFGTIITTTAGAVANIVFSVSTSTTDMVVCFGTAFNTITASNVTVRQQDAAHHVTRFADTAGPGSAISISFSAVNTSQNIVFLALNIAAPIVVAGSLPKGSMDLLGVGL